MTILPLLRHIGKAYYSFGLSHDLAVDGRFKVLRTARLATDILRNIVTRAPMPRAGQNMCVSASFILATRYLLMSGNVGNYTRPPAGGTSVPCPVHLYSTIGQFFTSSNRLS